MLKFLRSSFGTCVHKTARACGARGLKVWNVEETPTESHKKICVDSVNGSRVIALEREGTKVGNAALSLNPVMTKKRRDKDSSSHC